jgi:hypothetical protein
LIKTQAESPLALYVESRIDDYITITLKNCDGYIEDDKKSALEIINNPHISDEHKSAYLSVLQNVIPSLSEVDDATMREQLLIAYRVAHTESNVLDYFIEKDNVLTDELIDFINSDNNLYDFSNAFKQYNKYSKEIQRAFFNAVIQCDSLNDIHYRRFLITMGWHYKSGFAFKSIDQEKVDILIDTETIWMEKSNLEFIRNAYPNNLLHFITHKIKDYCELVIGTNLYKSDETIMLLDESIADKYKLKLLKGVNDKLTAINANYSDAIKAYILVNNYFANDLQHFASHYKSEGKKTKTEIVSRVIDWLKMPKRETLSVSIELYEAIVSSSIGLSAEDRESLFSYLLPNLSKTQCEAYLNNLRLNDFLNALNRGNPLIPVSDTNKRILEILSQNNWISSFSIDKTNKTYYKVYGKRSLTFRKEKK